MSFIGKPNAANELILWDGTKWVTGLVSDVNIDPSSAAFGANTIADLKAVDAPATLVKISVRGYYAPGDGGGGDFWWDSASNDTDNGGTVIQLDAGGTGRWKRIFDDAVDVRWFGAKGDSTTDDTSKIQSAVTATINAAVVQKNNAKIYFSPGKYRITGFITIVAAVPVSLEGNKSLSEIFIDNIDDGIGGSSGSAPLIIKNLKFSGTYARAINLSSGNSSTEISDCEFVGCTKTPSSGTQSVIFIVGQSDVWITNNYFHDNGEIFHTQKTYCIGNDTIPGAMARWHILENKIISAGTTNQIALFDLYDSEISNNYIDGYGRSAIWDGFADSYGIMIYRTHYHVVPQPQNNKIINNIIRNTAGTGIYLQGALDTLVDGNTLIDCVQSMSTGTALEIGAIALISPSDGDNTIISNNTIIGCRSRGISIQADGVSIVNNKIINNSDTPIFLDGDIKDGVVSGNRIDITLGTKAEVQGSTLPGFAVLPGDTAVIAVDGYAPVTTTFIAGDNSLNKVVYRINQAFIAAGQIGPAIGANQSGGGAVHDTLLIQSTKLGDNIGHTLGKVQIVSGTALAAIGLSATTVYGGVASGIVSSALGTITNFRFSKNTINSTYLGLYIGNICNDCTFTENYVTATTFQGYGIIGGSNNIFTGNHAISCGDRGIDVRFSDSLVQGNYSSNNGTHGLVVSTGTNNRVFDNDLRDNPIGFLITATSTEHKGNLTNHAAISNAVISVNEYGAIGDGVTDDTAAIQAAVTASFSAGRRVFFPAGDYRVTSQITIPEATTLFGIGNAPGGVMGTGLGYPAILHDFDGYLFVFNGANGSGPASGGGVESLRMVQIFGSPGSTYGSAIVVTGSDVDHIPAWIKIRNCIIEETLTDGYWTWGIIMDGKDAYANDGTGNIFMSQVASHTFNAAGGALYLCGVDVIISDCQFNLEGNVTVTGTPLVDSAAVTISNTTMRHLLVDYAYYVTVTGGIVVDITTTANTKFTNTFMPGVLTSSFTDGSGRASGAIWYEPNGLYDPSAGRFRVSKSILIPNNEALFGFNFAGDGIITMIATDGNNDIVINRTGGHNILLGAVTNLTGAGASDIVIPHSVALRSQNNAGNNTFSLIKSGSSDDTITVGGTTSDSLSLVTSASTSIFLTTGVTVPLTLTASAITIGTGVTLAATGTGNINLPNNASARFKIEGTSVGSTVTATNLGTLTDGSNADALHTHSAVFSSQVVVSGLTTTGITDGYFGYISSTNTLTKTDATSMASSRVFGANEGTVGTMTVAAVVDNAQFTTAGGSPLNGAPVYLAPSTEEAGATGKLTATKPTTAGQVVAEVGIVISNANYASLKTAKILLQVKAPIQL